MRRPAPGGAALLGAVLVAGRLAGGELQLADGAAPFRLGWREAAVAEQPAERLQAAPRCRSRKPLYLALPLGSGADAIVAGMLDESAGTGRGYDALRIDANNNEDLSDDAEMRTPAGETFGGERHPDPLGVAVAYADGTERVLRIQIELRRAAAEGAKSESWSAGCYAEQHAEGTLDIGERKGVRIAVYDAARGPAEANGCFNDYGADRLRLDVDGDGELDAETEDFPLSRVLAFEGRLWELALDPAARRAAARPWEGPGGTLRFAFDASSGALPHQGRVELISDNGLGFGLDPAGGRVFTLPADAYRIAAGRLLIRDGGGKTWQAVFSGEELVRIRTETPTEIRLGPPLRLALATQGDASPGQKLCVMPRLRGGAGELYENIAPAQTRMMPAVRVVDAEDIIVAEGRMDYG